MTSTPLKVAVFASGGGTNFQALLDHQKTQDLWRVVLLVQNREAGAARRAEAAGVPVRLIPTKDRDESELAAEMTSALDEYAVDVILLCGYLRRIPSEVTARFAGRMLNVHPALLPAFGGEGMYGMNVHRAVVESGSETTGATVHFVTPGYDEGAVLAQWHVQLSPHDTPEDVAMRVLRVEHELYPRAVDHLCAALAEGRAPERMNDVRLNEPPEQPRSIQPPESNEES